MNDRELDEILDSWQAPPVPPSLRAGLRSQFARQHLPRRSVRWLALFAAAAALMAVSIPLVDDAIPASDVFHWDSQTSVTRLRIVHPASALDDWQPALSTGARMVAGKLTGSVYMRNPKTGEHAGYTWTAAPQSPGRFLFAVLPLDPSVLREPGPIVPLSRLPAPGIVAAGAVFDVDLYRSATVRIYDHYQLESLLQPPLPNPPPAGSLFLLHPALFVNGRRIPGNGGVNSVTGPVLTVAVPHRGFFVISLAPLAAGLPQLPGAVKDKAIEFEFAGDRFRIESSALISSAGDLSVTIGVKPDKSLRDVTFASGDRTRIP